ncbi:MAG: carbohydrate porin [Chthoniobacterales bacterium]|jgi:porin|nr:carbohydrate porin [Chthoniobacterales bacterium]
MRRAAIGLLIALFLSPAVTTAQQGQGTDDTGQTLNLPWLQWDNATGDWWKNRSLFSDRGFEFTATYTAQVWGNVAGGIEQNASYLGLLQFGLDIDLEKVIGWKGASFNTTWVWMSGDQPTPLLVGSDYAVSGLEASAGFRCLDLWVQQNLFDGKLTLRAGMFNADRDFTISEYSSFFLNSAFGWPVVYDGMLGGVPAYPYAAPGISASWQPADGWILQTAVMQGEAFTQDANFYWNFNRMNGLMFLNEAIYSWKRAPLPGTVKLGAIFQTGYQDVPDGSGETWGSGFYYAIIDQAVYDEPGSTADSPQGLGWFARGGFSAPQKSSPLGMILQSGFVYSGLFPGRDDDSTGLALGWNQESSYESSGSQGSSRGLEMVVEASYQWQISPWFAVQPDLQYIIQPGGSTAIPNALVLGLSVSVDF